MRRQGLAPMDVCLSGIVLLERLEPSYLAMMLVFVDFHGAVVVLVVNK